MTNPESPPTDLRWSQEARLRAIDEAAFWEGRVNRAGLVRRFGISVPQATNDLREYQARAPANLRYDTREKAYLAEPGFQPLFGAPEAEAWLTGMVGNGGSGLLVAVIPRPMRMVDPWVVRQVVQAIRGGLALHVRYQPMDQPEPVWRWIAPHAFGSDGIRWHIRAWNADSERHEDLLFPRIVEVAEQRPAGALPQDTDWEWLVSIRLRPAARLSLGQRLVIEADYGMEDGEVCLEVRAALLFLFLRRLGVDRSDGLVEIANRDEVNASLAKVQERFRADAEAIAV